MVGRIIGMFLRDFWPALIRSTWVAIFAGLLGGLFMRLTKWGERLRNKIRVTFG